MAGVHLTYVDSRGCARTLEVAPGTTVMQGAKENAVPEIVADCGGACSCASCHVYVDPGWLNCFAPMSRNEDTLLSLLEDRRPNSRLACQLTVEDGMDGLVVFTPASGASD
ncbi:MAG: (2Fe-2S)-binding protein [Alphaproteobacteria bacterium]|nr:(2Fe-2S)-binding protein [Alphaproteobacteria bacterium]